MSTMQSCSTTHLASAASVATAAPEWWADHPADLSQDGSIPPADSDRLPVWFSAFLVTAYCSVFWVGVGTVLRWILFA